MKYESMGVAMGILYCVWQERKRKTPLPENTLQDCLSFLSRITEIHEKEEDWIWHVENKKTYVRTTLTYKGHVLYRGLHTLEVNGTFRTAYMQGECAKKDASLITAQIEHTLSRLVYPPLDSLLFKEEEVKRRLKTHLRILKRRG